jgi:predicted transcriptional regulator
MTTTDIFDALDASGVSISDFAKLTGCSRVTLHKWKRDVNTPIRDALRLKIALTTAMRIKRAVDAGKLPLKDTYLVTQRLKVLQSIIAQS